ncbi:hypothetical protein BKA93DRAFT_156934 [Sparassis latifolia]
MSECEIRPFDCNLYRETPRAVQQKIREWHSKARETCADTPSSPHPNLRWALDFLEFWSRPLTPRDRSACRVSHASPRCAPCHRTFRRPVQTRQSAFAKTMPPALFAGSRESDIGAAISMANQGPWDGKKWKADRRRRTSCSPYPSTREPTQMGKSSLMHGGTSDIDFRSHGSTPARSHQYMCSEN